MTPQPTAGYSGTPLAKKLGIKPGMSVCALDAPAGYRDLLAPIPEGVGFVAKASASTDVVHAFATRKATLAEALGLVDGKVCAVDSVWSGLKLVIRKELRGVVPGDGTKSTLRASKR